MLVLVLGRVGGPSDRVGAYMCMARGVPCGSGTDIGLVPLLVMLMLWRRKRKPGLR